MLREGIEDTVIIDEASMLTTEMMGALLNTVRSAKRIIFVGDPHQLPPIGAGRPFVDLVKILEKNVSDSAFPKASVWNERYIYTRKIQLMLCYQTIRNCVVAFACKLCCYFAC